MRSPAGPCPAPPRRAAPRPPHRAPRVHIHTLCSDKTPAALFFRYNTQLGPPYQVIIDTNFINFSIRNKIDLVKVRAADVGGEEEEEEEEKMAAAQVVAVDRCWRLHAGCCCCSRSKQHVAAPVGMWLPCSGQPTLF